MLVFKKEIIGQLAEFSLRRMTEEGLHLVKNIPLQERTKEMRGAPIQGFIGKDLNYKVAINDQRDIVIQISDTKDDLLRLQLKRSSILTKEQEFKLNSLQKSIKGCVFYLEKGTSQNG